MSADHQDTVDPASVAVLADRVFCPMTGPALHHVSLFVSDIEAPTRFRTEHLGLSLHEEFDDIIGLRGANRFPFTLASLFLEAGEGRYIELDLAGEGEMAPPGFPMNHLALVVVDVDAACGQALAAGGKQFDIPMPDEEWDGTPLNVMMSGARPKPLRITFQQGPSAELIELYQASIND